MENDEQILPVGINTGVRIDPIRPTDFVAGAETGVAKVVLEESGQFDAYLPDEESQWKRLFDTFACVSFSADNCIETLLTRLISKNLLPAGHLKFLKDEGYIDPQTGKVNFSDRFTAKMSGTTRDGNSLPAVGDAIRSTAGMVPEKDWQWPEGITESMPLDDKWNLYYAEIPEEVKAKGKRFLQYFEIKYQWVLLGTPNNDTIREQLKYGPIQIAASVCSPWSSNDGMPPIPACGCGTGHATTVYGFREDDKALKDFDHYKSFRKLLAPDYCIPYALQYTINAKIETAPAPFKYTFTQYLVYGAADSAEVRNLQKALQTVKDATGKPYMKVGVFGPYGPQTRDALARFQMDNGIADPQPGEHFGPLSRTALNAKLNG